MWKETSGIFGRQLGRYRLQVAHALHDLGGGNATLLGVSGRHLERAQDTNMSLIGAPTLPAWQRYTGVVWDHLDPGSLSESAMERARSSIVIVSGLLGLVGFAEPIPDYKLKIGASLELSGDSTQRSRSTLAAYWQPRVSPVLNRWLEGRTVIDLLPLEHRRAWEPSADLDVLRISFVDSRGRSVGHDAKAAKGTFVRHVLTSRSAVRALETWKHPNYRIDVSPLR